ncbi:MAG: C25 family cysteine peptidase [bacterium]|nr:C25 family cysteine peptidase [bacterium]
MKKNILLLTGAAWLCLNLFAVISPASTPPGQEPTLRVLSANPSGLEFTFDLPDFKVEYVNLAGTEYQTLSFPGSAESGEIGEPCLPVLRKLVRLPQRSGWTYRIISSDYEEVTSYKPPPNQEGTVETPDGKIEPETMVSQEAYALDRFYPSEPVHLAKPVIMRDFRLGLVEICPMQYNPVRGILRIYHRVTIKITFEGDGENPITRVRAQKSRVFANLVNKSVLNPEVGVTDEDYVLGGYLFITPPALQTVLEANLVEWKKQKGFPCTVLNTNQTGISSANIQTAVRNIYTGATVPPEYLILVGDADYGMPTFYYPADPYGQRASDLPYTLIEGADYFPEMLVGRLSIDSGTDLATVCSKIRNYESNPSMSSTEWFTRGLMVYDYSGSLSCKSTKVRCKDLMLADGYTEVTEVTNPPTYYGATPINNAINSPGVTFVNYRGYGSTDGWTPPNYNTGNISSLSNGFRLPIITSIVCGGGDFIASNDPCFGEAWLRYGTASNPKGAVGFVGPSSVHTHTKWNNAIDGGIYQGIFQDGIGDFGSAVLRGKMELYYNMPLNLGPGQTTNSVECYFYIYNILGDPGLEMWTGVPAIPEVTCPTSLPQGVNSFTISVHSAGTPVQDALVCVYDSASGYQNTAWTNAGGSALLNLASTVAGNYKVTVTKHNLKPYIGTLSVQMQAVALGIDHYVIDDDNIGESQGNGDGLFNPGETIELVVTLKNTGSSQTATGVVGAIGSTDPYLTITQSSLTGPDATPGATSLLGDDFNLVLSPEAPDGHIIPVQLRASCSQGFWNNLIDLTVVAPLAEAVACSVQNAAGYLIPGQSGNVTMTLLNSGGAVLANCQGTLHSPDSRLVVTDANGSWGTIAPRAWAENLTNPFTLQVANSCPAGLTVPLQLTVNSGIYCDTLPVNFYVGRVVPTYPTEPDAYGYRCFDSRDSQYDQRPVYQWIEASTQPGQVTINLPDHGEEQDMSTYQNLPFVFTYYGQSYTIITICSNGWMAIGNCQTYFDARNMNIPGALGPPAMIAPFWDDLHNDISINYWQDTNNHRVVVEWKDVHTAGGNGVNRFEVILYDPQYYPTSTGDGEIVFQYYTFNNVDASDNYCTIGIENWQQNDGVEVSHANLYSPGSAVITAGTALKFTTDFSVTSAAPNVTVTLTPTNPPIVIPAQGGTFNFDVAIHSAESNPATWQGWIMVTDPFGAPFGPVFGPVGGTIPGGATMSRNRNQYVPPNAPAGTYGYTAFVGPDQTTAWDSSSFNFTKLAGLSGNGIGEWLNDGESFDQSAALAQPIIPDHSAIMGVLPNPFNPTTVISYELRTSSFVNLSVYDISGRKVAELVNNLRDAGAHSITFDGSNLASGIYIYRLTAGEFNASGKMVLLK